MFNPIEARKRLTQERIEKSFNDGLSVSEEIEKGRHGIYEDNAENRRKNRVGQEYGHAAQQKELSGKQHGAAKTIDDHASAASDEALKRAAADEKAKPEVREAAKKELESRGEKKLSNKTSGKWYAADASSEDLERYIKDPKSDPKLVKEAKKELESRGVNSGGDKGDAGLGNKVAKQIIDDAKDYYAHNGDYHGYNSLKDYIDSGDWADDVDSDEFDDAMEAIQHVTKSLKELTKRNGGESGDDKNEKTSSVSKNSEMLRKRDYKINATLSKMTFDGNKVSWPADLDSDVEDVQDKYDFSLDDVSFDEKKNQFTGYAFKVDFDSSGEPSSRPYNAERELGKIQAKTAAAKKDKIIKKLKQNAVESKEAKKLKSYKLKRLLEDGADKDDSIFMSQNESYFKDVLAKYGFDSWDDFEEWGAEGADDDWDKYEKIFKTCFNKIPAKKFLKKSSFDELNSVSDLIEEIRNSR